MHRYFVTCVIRIKGLFKRGRDARINSKTNDQEPNQHHSYDVSMYFEIDQLRAKHEVLLGQFGPQIAIEEYPGLSPHLNTILVCPASQEENSWYSLLGDISPRI